MTGRKNANTHQLVVDGDMSSNITSEFTNMLYQDNIGITLEFSGTPTGEFFADLSNDSDNWQAMTFSEGSILASGSAGSHALTIKQFSYKYIRLRYVFSSGTGVLNAFITTKMI